MQDNKNLFLAIALSLAVLVGWNAFFGLPNPEEHRKQIEAAKQPASGAQAPSAAAPSAPVIVPVSEALKTSARVQIEAPKIIGSFPLTGGEIDDISFRNYHETVDPKSPLIRVLSPYGSEEAYFADSFTTEADKAKESN